MTRYLHLPEFGGGIIDYSLDGALAEEEVHKATLKRLSAIDDPDRLLTGIAIVCDLDEAQLRDFLSDVSIYNTEPFNTIYEEIKVPLTGIAAHFGERAPDLLNALALFLRERENAQSGTLRPGALPDDGGLCGLRAVHDPGPGEGWA
jgi:hypothetical protein